MSTAIAALLDARAALAKATAKIDEALRSMRSPAPAPETDGHGPVARATTAAQIAQVLTQHDAPLTLPAITEIVCDLRGVMDAPRVGGGTVMQEVCRTSLSRMIKRGIVERVPPVGKGHMRFRVK